MELDFMANATPSNARAPLNAYSACSFCSTQSLTGVTLVAAFLGFFALCAMLVEWWNSTWRVAVEPVRSEVYGARMIPSPCFYRSWWWWRSSGVSRDMALSFVEAQGA